MNIILPSILVLLSGIWLNFSGKPYSVIILASHKIISLATAALFARTIYLRNGISPFDSLERSVIIAAGVLFLVTVIAGGLVSTGKPMPAWILILHRVTPFLVVLSTASALYLLLYPK